MGKINKRILRRDLAPNHVHSLPNGQLTYGVQYKPNANHRAGFHTHLYMHDGMLLESDAAYEGDDHVHDTEFGFTSGPMPAPKHRGEEFARTDAKEEMPPDEQVALDFLGDDDVDEGLWEKAKRASEHALGMVKWPFVMWFYKEHGGS